MLVTGCDSTMWHHSPVSGTVWQLRAWVRGFEGTGEHLVTWCGLSVWSADTRSPVGFGRSIDLAAHSCILAWQPVPTLAAERSHLHCWHCAESNMALGACQRTVALHPCLHQHLAAKLSAWLQQQRVRCMQAEGPAGASSVGGTPDIATTVSWQLIM